MINGDLTQAITWTQRAIEVAPDDVLSRKRLALALVAQGHDEQAIEHFEAAVRLDPENGDVPASLARGVRSN